MKRFAAIAIILILASGMGSTAHAMDLVRRETKTDEAVAKYGVTGKGVTIAILDRGID